MTSLVPQKDQAQKNLDALADALTLQEVLTRVAARKVAAEPEKVTKKPNVLPITEAAKAAIQSLNEDLGAVEMPTERRKLTRAEAKDFIILGREVKDAEKALKIATAAIKEAVFNDLDTRLEADNDSELLPVDQKTGHYLVDGELEVPETGLRFCRETRQASPDLTADDLLKLYDNGDITRAEYLKATRQTRVVNEEGLMAVLKDNPQVLEALAQVVEPGAVTAAFIIREVKKDK